MKCFNCGNPQMKTIYPTNGPQKFVQKWCLVCGYKSYPTEVPQKLPESGE